MAKLFLEVVTPERVMVSQEVDTVVAPGSEGEFGVLPGHINFLSGIIPGELRYDTGSGKERMVVTTGFAEVSNDKISVLVEAAEKVEDIVIERAREAAERARKRLSRESADEDLDFIRAEIALKRAITRIRVAEKSI